MKLKLVLPVVSALVLVVLLGARAQPASAETSVVVKEPFSFVTTCPGEEVAITGEETVIQTGTVNPTGGSSAHFTFILSGTGVGPESGTFYRLQGVSASGFYFRDAGEFPGTADFSMFVQTWVLVPTGAGTPLSFQETLVAVFNAQGELVSFQFVGDADCQ
jgi:hypothetical protein